MLALALLGLCAAGPDMALARNSRRSGGVAAIAITPTRLLGRWGDNGDCSKDVIFRGDGTFRAYNGGEGSWRLAGERLTMTGENGSSVLIVRMIDRNHIRITNPDGSIGISQRC
jgi:hypothetical protein